MSEFGFARMRASCRCGHGGLPRGGMLTCEVAGVALAILKGEKKAQKIKAVTTVALRMALVIGLRPIRTFIFEDLPWGELQR